MDLYKLIPSKIRKLIRPYYLLIFKSKKQIEKEFKYKVRDWNLDIEFPEKEKVNILNTTFSGILDYKYKSKSKTVILFSMPKSASLYLTQLLSSSLEYSNYQIGFNQKSGDIYYPRLISAVISSKNTISHCHSYPSRDIIQLIENFNLTPIVLYRNLLDVLISRRDMLIKDKWADEILSDTSIKKFINSDSDYQLHLIIDIFANDYFNFYKGWKENEMKLRLLFIRFEDLIEDEVKLVRKVGDYLGKSFNEGNIQKVINDIKSLGGINFNKGIIGRGKELLNDSHIKKLKEKAEIFNCYDPKFLGFKI